MKLRSFAPLAVLAVALGLSVACTPVPCPAAEGAPELAASHAGPVLAAVPAPAPALTNAVLGVVDRTVWPLLGAFVTTLLSLALSKLSKKWGGDVLRQQHDLLEAVAMQGLSYAEERAAAALKHKGVTLGGSDRLNLALDHILATVPAVSRTQATAVVESLLARTFGVGATGDKEIGLGVVSALVPEPAAAPAAAVG